MGKYKYITIVAVLLTALMGLSGCSSEISEPYETSVSVESDAESSVTTTSGIENPTTENSVMSEENEEPTRFYENAMILIPYTQMVEGRTADLELSGADNAGKIRWESEAPQLATVDENGKVTALAEGDAMICCYDERNNRIADITLFIYKPEDVVREAVITDKISELELHGEGWLHWEGEGVYDTVIWSSSDNDILTVSWRGIIYASGKGTATLYLTNIDGEPLDSVTITVS